MLKPENKAHAHKQWRINAGWILKSELKREYKVSEKSISLLYDCDILTCHCSYRHTSYRWVHREYISTYSSNKKLIDKIARETYKDDFYPSQETMDLIKGMFYTPIKSQ